MNVLRLKRLGDKNVENHNRNNSRLMLNNRPHHLRDLGHGQGDNLSRRDQLEMITKVMQSCDLDLVDPLRDVAAEIRTRMNDEGRRW